MNAAANKLTWTPERIATLRESVAAGMTYAQIGKAMGLSKNQCCGKADRLGLRLGADAPGSARQQSSRGWAGPEPRTIHDRLNEIHARLDAVLAETRNVGRLPGR
jgi:hypothetical protein